MVLMLPLLGDMFAVRTCIKFDMKSGAWNMVLR
jgi:hypothetical protein